MWQTASDRLEDTWLGMRVIDSKGSTLLYKSDGSRQDPEALQRDREVLIVSHYLQDSLTWHDLERFSGSMLSTSSSPSSLLWGLEHHVCAKAWFRKAGSEG